MKEKEINLELTDEALSLLAKVGYDPHFGARPLNRLIQTKILNPIAMHLIQNSVSKGDTVNVTVLNNELVIETKKVKGKVKSNIKTRATRSVK